VYAGSFEFVFRFYFLVVNGASILFKFRSNAGTMVALSCSLIVFEDLPCAHAHVCSHNKVVVDPLDLFGIRQMSVLLPIFFFRTSRARNQSFILREQLCIRIQN
jgi:hypothetical protein